MGDTARAARKAKSAQSAAKAPVYLTGTVTEVTSTTRCRVAAGDKEVPCVVPESLMVSVDDQVQIRIRGNDYAVSAVLSGEKQAAWVAETAEQAAEQAGEVNTFAHDLEVEMNAKLAEASEMAADALAAAEGAQASADGKTMIYYSATAPTGGPFAVGDTWFDTANGYRISRWDGTDWALSELGSSAIADAAITNAKIANATIQSAKIAALDAGKVTTGILAAARIAAGSLTADKMLIGAFDNLIANGGGEANSTLPHSTSSPNFGVTVSNAVVRSGSFAFLVTESSVPAAAQTFIVLNGGTGEAAKHVPCSVGEQFYVEGYAKAGSGTQSPMAMWVGFYNAAGAALSYINGATITPTTSEWTKVSHAFTAPAGAAYWVAFVRQMGPGLGSAGATFYLDDFYARKRLTGDLIVDGAITADKLSANAIDGKTITGATVQTGASGRRLVLSGATMNGYTDTGYGSAQYSPDNAYLSAATGRYARMTPDFIQKMSDDGLDSVLINDAGISVYGLDTNTSGSAATWVAVSTPAAGWYVLRRNTSLRAAKVAYQDIDVTAADILRLGARQWFDRAEVDEAGLDPETATAEECLAAGLRWVPGFIAEEVEEVAPIFCLYSGDGDLEGVAYDRLAAGLLVLARRQSEQLQDLETRLAAIEATLAGQG